jgi:CHAT domain-containing protein
VREALQALRSQMASQHNGGAARLARHQAQLADRTRRCLADLYRLVWQPFAHELRSATSVRVLPSGPLASLPFGALWNGDMHLVQHQAITLAASLELPRPAPLERPIERVVAFADSQRLPGALAEAQALLVHWPGATVRTGDDATLAALRSEAPRADLLHLACHGEFRPDSPLFSALHLQRGTLTALEAERLPLAARLVVLSACETALSESARDDEALGLVRAFLIAGAREVLGGLWAIDDAATARWMAAFHARLAGGVVPSQALAAQQREGIAQGAHPYFWAGFALHGAP